MYYGNNLNVTARLTESNYSNGRFSLNVEEDGNLRLWMVNFPTQMQYNSYWQTDTHVNKSRLVFNESTALVYVQSPNGTILYQLTAINPPSPTEFYNRLTLDYDGVLRHYYHPKSKIGIPDDQSTSWTLLSSSIPNLICDWNSPSPSIGSGFCGFNTICKMNDSTVNNYTCDCVWGYSIIDEEEPWRGCKPDGIPIAESCNSNQSGVEIKTLYNLDWPQVDYEGTYPTTTQACQTSCLKDCFCYFAVFTTNNQGCYKKSLPLANGRVDTSGALTVFIKVPINSTVTHKSKYRPWAIGTSITSGLSVLVNVFFLLSIWPTVLSKMKKRGSNSAEQSDVGGPTGDELSFGNLRSFSYEELEESTDGFAEEIGRGSFGTVYRGVVECDDDSEISIAVKRLDKAQISEGEKEFRTELNIIGQTNHRNLVKLLGYCNQANHRILVYEFMSKGSLSSLLFTGANKPKWRQRFRILVSVAKGLAYLHQECNNPIIHCDIKSQNILLNDSLDAKIADFGLSKLLKKDQSGTYTDVRGTRGYVAPEWFTKGAITTKVDIYSFGVLVLEMIYCRRSFEPNLEEEGASILVDWAYDCYRNGKLPSGLGLCDEENEMASDDWCKRMDKLLMIGIWCVQQDASLRPTIRKVVLMLEESADVAAPPNPSNSNYDDDTKVDYFSEKESSPLVNSMYG